MLPQPQASPLIAGSVLPIKKAEELLQTLPAVMAVRIIASDTGAVDEIHVLTTSEATPKQTVRNIESALIAHLGMRVDHRKISVATTVEGKKAERGERKEARGEEPVVRAVERVVDKPLTLSVANAEPATRRRIFYFEDVEVRRSRTKGLSCRVTLTKGGKSFIGEAEGMEHERTRVELSARAALKAIVEGDAGARPLELCGAKVIDAFDREFVFVGVTAKPQRELATILTGSSEVRDSPETASVLAVLDATNRWLTQTREGQR
jgi:hypothetical protein